MLRGLGPTQTLVSINCKCRHQTSFLATFGTRGRAPVEDTSVPFRLQRLIAWKILRDGASAQYGSDAMAGVINIILKVRTLSADLGFSGYYDQDYNPAFRSENDLKGEYIYENKLDGATYNIGANYGLPIGKKGGFLEVTAFYANAAKTYRQEIDVCCRLISIAARTATLPCKAIAQCSMPNCLSAPTGLLSMLSADSTARNLMPMLSRVTSARALTASTC